MVYSYISVLESQEFFLVVFIFEIDSFFLVEASVAGL
jgi:hypothetical protein